MDNEARLAAALARQRDGDLDGARAHYLALLAVDPENPDGQFGAGTVCLQQGDAKRALPFLRRACTRLPDVPEFLFNLGLAEAALADTRAAAVHLLRAGTLSGDDPDLLLRTCKRLSSLGCHREVVMAVRESGCQDFSVLGACAEAQARLGDWAGALDNLRRVVAARPAEPAAQRELSRVAARMRDYPLAIAAFDAYLALSEPSAANQVALADLLLMARRPEQASAAVDRAVALGAAGADVELLAARCARLEGRYDAAREHLRAATADRPRAGNPWWLLTELETDSAALDAIAADCHRLAREPDTQPHDVVLLALTAGQAAERLGRYDAAFTDYHLGNATQQGLLAQRKAQYDPRATEDLGRWLEALVPEPLAPPVDIGGHAPIFIVGMPRSGTTLVERILATREGVAAGGENEALEFVAMGYYREHRLGRTPGPGQLDVAARDALVEEYWRRTGAAPGRLTDKLLQNFRHAGLIAAMFPDAPIVHLRRDPRDVAVSIYSRPFPEGHAYACDLAAIGHYYRFSERLMAHWQRVLPGRILDVPYEALVADPENATRRIVEFCGLSWDSGCLDFHDQMDNAAFTFSELQVRQALNDRGIGRWRNYRAHLEPLLDALATEA